MELERDISRFLFVAGVLFLLLIWCLWKDLRDENAFHPDEINQCPPYTYTILQDEITKFKCIYCPNCPAGEEPSPRCGTTLVTKVVGKCTPCKQESFSDEHGSAMCKSCSECGSQKVINACTATKDTECYECPLNHFKDNSTRTCKHCSSCCTGQYPFAMWNCIISKQCTANCSHLSTSASRLSERYIKGPNSTASTADDNSVTNDVNRRSNIFEIKIKSKLKRLTRSIESRDNPAKVVNKKHMGNTESETENSVPFSLLHEESLPEKLYTDSQPSQSPDIIKRIPELSIVTSSTITDQDAMPSTATTMKNVKRSGASYSKHLTHKDEDASVSRPILSLTTKANYDLTKLATQTGVTTHMPLELLASTSNAQLLSPGYILDNFLGTSAALFLFGSVGVILYIGYRKFFPQLPTGSYKRLSSYEERAIAREDNTSLEEKGESCNLMSVKTSEICDKATATRILNDFSLSEIPHDLQDMLIMKLDVPNKAESESYGWQKVGRAFSIPQTELDYFNIEYLRPNGSPTKLLLDSLGCKGKTICDLIDVLQKPSVEFHEIAELIIRRVLLIERKQTCMPSVK